MGLLDKFKDKVSKPSSSSSSSDTSFPAAPAMQSLGAHDVIRYRRQIGVNLGSWFVLERWISSHPFREAVSPGQSDHDIAKGGHAKAIFEEHWDNWITDDDWKWIKDHGYNSVRLPIGYYHLVKPVPAVTKGTDFDSLGWVFEGAWERIEKAISKASSLGLGVMVDLHAAAGAQNADGEFPIIANLPLLNFVAHSGMSNGKPRLFDAKANLTSTSLALRFLASHFASNPNVIGLELLNEPANNSHLQKWYESTLAELRPLCGPHFPIYVHDAWDTQWYAGWVGKRNDFVVLDHHLYRCFTDGDKALNGQQHAEKLLNEFQGGFANQSNQAHGNLVVAEWSASLDLSRWKGMQAREQDAEKRAFVKAELELYEKHAAGSWFWTLKKEEGWDAGWSATNATQAEILPAWGGSKKFKGDPGDGVKQQALEHFHGQHISYWQANGGLPKPTLFEPAFKQGWADALLFFSSSSVSELGFVNQWAKRRLEEYKAAGHDVGGSGWEWEQAFAQAVGEAKRVCLD
ncbi:cytoplasm protein [Naematelia encephala]|uniref:Cytoplasm protein n=1 Tax=Naematelia encephala TaxID=71784 RepID=A0A1Y2AYX6_9TREE|nr:cytoplasm protein [Naematelia encephala]